MTLSLAAAMFKFLFSRTFLIQIILAVLVLCGSIAGAYFYLVSYTVPDKIVEVPDLSELDIVEAEAFLKNLNLRDSIIDSIYDPSRAGGEIVKQDPLPGALAKEGRKIYVTIARYTAEMVTFPNILDQSLALSEAKLTSYGYKVGELEYVPSVGSDYVVSAAHKGKEIKPGDKTPFGIEIDISVGMGEGGDLVSIPLVYGLNIEEAKQLLNMHGLNMFSYPCPKCETKEDTLSAIAYQADPSPESKQVPKGTPVTIFFTPDDSEVPETNVDSVKALLK